MKKNPPDFEKAMADLEALVNRLEAGELPLATALSDFEKGIKLVRQCQAHLDEARAQVNQLMDDEQSSAPESNETSD